MINFLAPRLHSGTLSCCVPHSGTPRCPAGSYTPDSALSLCVSHTPGLCSDALSCCVPYSGLLRVTVSHTLEAGLQLMLMPSSIPRDHSLMLLFTPTLTAARLATMSAKHVERRRCTELIISFSNGSIQLPKLTEPVCLTDFTCAS